jgi:transcriptional regulator with XRE-family HTH domain
MSPIRIMAESEDTITISRHDWETLQDELQELQDRTAVAERRAYERLVGKEHARRDYLTGDEAMRLLSGASPLKVWREKRGLSQRALAAASGISGSYLAEIESDRKPGSDDAFRKLAVVLRIPSEELRAKRYRGRDPDFGPVLLSLNPSSAGISQGNRGTWADLMEFPTIRDSLDFLREKWSSVRTRDPSITDIDRLPIFSTDELIREIGG